MTPQEYLKDVRLHRMGAVWWPHVVRWLDASDEQRTSANYRSAMPDEIIIDIDSEVERASCVSKLESIANSYTLWATGGRGYHADSYWPQLLGYSQEQRNRARKAVVEYCGGCGSTTSESHLIGIENRPHRRTGQLKTLFYRKDNGSNELPLFALIEIARERPKRQIIQSIPKEAALNDPFLQYALTHVLPDHTDRKMKVIKNMAVLFHNSGLSDAEINGLVERLLVNMPGTKLHEFDGWLKWAREAPREYNRIELASWLMDNAGVICHA